MKRHVRIMPEDGERYAVQPFPSLPRWPDGSLKQLDSEEYALNWFHVNKGHVDPVTKCFSCQWENSI